MTYNYTANGGNSADLTNTLIMMSLSNNLNVHLIYTDINGVSFPDTPSLSGNIATWDTSITRIFRPNLLINQIASIEFNFLFGITPVQVNSLTSTFINPSGGMNGQSSNNCGY